MAKGAGRLFTVLDALVLVAATAIGFAWVRSNWYFETFGSLGTWITEAPGMLGPVLLMWTIAIAVLRLKPPRPPMRRLVLQPGAAACGSVACGFMIQCVSYFVLSTARMHRIPWALFRAGGGVGPELIMNTVDGAPYHYLVMAVWGLLLLGRRCRPEPTWIDRAGRAIGVSWLLLALWFWWDCAIGEWAELSG